MKPILEGDREVNLTIDRSLTPITFCLETLTEIGQQDYAGNIGLQVAEGVVLVKDAP